MSIFKSFWAELNTPDDFSDKPYEGGMNQLGHKALGAYLSGYICVICGVAFGVMPYKEAVMIGMLLFYGGVIEWYMQRSPIKDGLTDTFFVLLGAAIPLVSLTEVSTINGEIWLRLEQSNAIAAMLLSKVCLAIYIAPRAWRKYRNSAND